jgi:hypothetical protein
MRFVYVLENDPKFMKEITEALLQVDPRLQVRQFKSLEGFAHWLKLLLEEGPAAIRKGGAPPVGFQFPAPSEEEPILQLVISKIEFLGARQLGLLKKTREMFIRHRVCTAEDPTAFVLTAFEDPNFHVRDLKDRILSNILMKPFDRLILQQHLTFALDGRHLPSKHAVAPYKTSAVIEVLKTVEMERLAPTGFTTHSNRPLPIGTVSKYYGKIFVSDRQRSLIAKTISCDPDPSRPGEYIAKFAFFAADPTQIVNIRRKVLTVKAKPGDPNTVRPKNEKQTCRIVLVEDRKEVMDALVPTLKRKIKGLEIVHYQNLKELFLEVDPKMDKEKQTTKALSAPALEAEIDLQGKVTKLEGAAVTFAGQSISLKMDLTTWFRENDRNDFLAWLVKPEGSRLWIWASPGKSFLMKITFLQGRKFRIEEASAADRDEYARRNSRLSKGWDFMFVSHHFAGSERMDLWKEVIHRGKTMGGQGAFKNFVIAAQEYSDEEERRIGTLFDDLFFFPLERVYVMQKMVLYCPELTILEDPVEIVSIEHREEIKSARPAEIEELSEAGLVMKYDRAMSLGSFREFVLWQPYEIDAPEINATCNFSEETPAGFRLHFVFFAMKDVLLKAIRGWIMENYILSKDKG